MVLSFFFFDIFCIAVKNIKQIKTDKRAWLNYLFYKIIWNLNQHVKIWRLNVNTTAHRANRWQQPAYNANVPTIGASPVRLPDMQSVVVLLKIACPRRRGEATRPMPQVGRQAGCLLVRFWWADCDDATRALNECVDAKLSCVLQLIVKMK